MGADRSLVTMAMLVMAGAGAAAQTPQQLQAGGISPPFAQYLQSKSNRDVINQVIRMQVSSCSCEKGLRPHWERSPVGMKFCQRQWR